ncbi:MAG: hypothetical protein JEZ12_11480 [Desulfobacterium sp.]|nr:hypothetical protein [Desulfobacterium sp.]
MPQNIQSLASLNEVFSNVGDRHVGLKDQNQLQVGANNWLGRTVNWIKSALNIGGAAQENRSIMNHVIGTIRDTPGMGDRFAQIAKGNFGSALEKGTPITGRQISRVLGDIFRIKSEDMAQAANIKLNVRDFCDSPSGGPGSVSFLVKSMETKMKVFGMAGEMDALTADDYKGIKDKLAEKIAGNGVTPSPDQLEKGLLDACRRFSLDRYNDHIENKVQAHCDHSGPDSALPTALRDRAAQRGIKVDMGPDHMGKLLSLIQKKVTVTCGYDLKNIHPPSDTEVQALREKVIDSFLNSLQVIDDNTSLTPREKEVAREVVNTSSLVFTKGMAGALCDGIRDTHSLVQTLHTPGLTSGQVSDAMDTFIGAMDRSFLDEQGKKRDGIDGMDEVAVVKEALLQGGFKLGGLDGDMGMAVFGRLTATGSAMNACRFSQERQDMGNSVHQKKQAAYVEVMTTLARHLGVPKKTLDRQSKGPGLDGVTFDQARAFLGPGVHADKGLPGIHGFDMDNALQFLSKNINEDMTSPLQKAKQGDSIDPQSLKDKSAHFSEDFLKDFFRNGIIVDGEAIPGSGTNDKGRMEQTLDRLISKFPSINEAGQTTRGLFQASGATLLILLMNDPSTREAFLNMNENGGDKRTDKLTFSLTSKGSGQYDVSMDFVLQLVRYDGNGVQDTPDSISTHTNMTITGSDQAETTPLVTVHDFDFIMGSLEQ